MYIHLLNFYYKGHNMSNIVYYKLTSGEEIIAKEISVGDAATIIDEAVTLVYQQSDKGVSVGFAPFMPQSEGTIALWHTSIAAVATPNAQVKTEHVRIFSGIVLAGSI
jgi:hypothetical protein